MELFIYKCDNCGARFEAKHKYGALCEYIPPPNCGFSSDYKTDLCHACRKKVADIESSAHADMRKGLLDMLEPGAV